MKNIDALSSYLNLLKNLGDLYWQWQHVGIIQLGVIVCGSSSSRIRQRALEEGLLFFIQIEDSICKQEKHSINHYETANESAWKIRCATAVSLIAVYQQFGAQAQGLLAHEVLHSRKNIETNSYIVNVLHSPAANIPQSLFAKQLSFLGQYIYLSIAEMQSDSQNNVNCHKSINNISLKFQPVKQNKARAKNIHLPNFPEANLSTRNGQHIKLSVKPYHQKYKTESMAEIYDKTVISDNKILRHSSLGVTHKLLTKPILAKPEGTFDRRKLFNAKQDMK
jgi:hypothetical protein